jgi:DNA end-binding protein Ku
MAPRTSWKGFIELSLVSVPVKAYTANNTTEDVHLNQLHEGCHQRVRYKKVCPEHGELASAEIVSGYEFTKGQYVIIEPGELAKLRKESDKAIHIEGFIDAETIEPRYHAGKTYYLLPDGVAGTKPYALLHRGMTEQRVHAIAQIVLSGREQLVLVRPMGELLAMTVLQHEKKIKPVEDFTGELGQQKLGKEEMALTDTLIGASRLADFKLGDFEDKYVKNLTRLIQMKVDGQEIVAERDPEEPKILNLMDALKRSVAEAQASDRQVPSTGTGRKKMAASARKKKAAPRKKKSG